MYESKVLKRQSQLQQTIFFFYKKYNKIEFCLLQILLGALRFNLSERRHTIQKDHIYGEERNTQRVCLVCVVSVPSIRCEPGVKRRSQFWVWCVLNFVNA